MKNRISKRELEKMVHHLSRKGYTTEREISIFIDGFKEGMTVGMPEEDLMKRAWEAAKNGQEFTADWRAQK